MKTIFTKYHGPSNARGSRISASDGDGHFVVIHRDCAHSIDYAHSLAARELCLKMGWDGKLVGHEVCKAGRITGMLWFFENDPFTVRTEIKGVK